MSKDLVTFLRARLDEDEAVAKDERYVWPTAFEVTLNPARVLREVEAHRAILEMYAGALSWSWPPGDGDEAAQDTLRTVAHHLVAIWRDHPDYGEAWAQERRGGGVP
jgi:Family of unknown function (DUF6221)